MRFRRRASARFFTLFAIVGLLALPSAGLAVEPTARRDAVVSSGPQAVTQADQDRIRTYWTQARMDAAKPMPMPRPEARTPTTGISRQATGTAGSVKASHTDTREGVVVSGGAQTVGYTYPFPFTRYNQENQVVVGTFPAMAAGKMFFSQPGGNFVCSAASVAGNPTQIAWTAGHCVSNGAGTFSTNVLFVPAHRPPGSIRPYGTFPGGALWTTSAWHFSGDLTADHGAFTVGTNAAGQTLRSRVGFLGFAWNQSRIQHWDSVGYPAAAPFTGNTQVRCEASHAVDDTGIPGVQPDPIGIGCDMTGGSSGGPWVLGWRTNNFINGHNSYKYPATQPGAMYSPYIEDLANQVRCAAANSGNPPPC